MGPCDNVKLMASTELSASQLTSGSLLAKNTVWNLGGQLLPMAAAVFCLPPLVHHLGVERFGILSLAWILIGYFSFFDLGIGRAVTKIMADRLGSAENEGIPSLFWTSALLMLLMGFLGGALTLATSRFLVLHVLRIPVIMHAEAIRSFHLLAFCIPLVTVTSGLRGVLEAQQRFRIINMIRVPMSIFSVAGPLLVLPFSQGLVPIVVILVFGRLAGLCAYIWACFSSLPGLHREIYFRKSDVVALLTFGGWISLANILWPAISYVDRFLVGALLSVGAVAYYTAPLDMITRLTIIPSALAGVLFPAFTVSLVHEPSRVSMLFQRGIKYILLATFPIVLAIVVFAPEVLRVWLGAAFSEHAGIVLRWLTVGVFISCLAQLPAIFVQSAGRPDLSAKLYAIELPLYLLAIWIATTRFGLAGTAVVWTMRVTIDAAFLFYFTLRLLPVRPRFILDLIIVVSSSLIVFYVGSTVSSLMIRSGYLVLVLVAFGLLSWYRGLQRSERSMFLKTLAS